MIYLAWKNIRHHARASALSVLLVALSVALMLFVLHVDRQTQEALEGNQAGVDLILSAKGSPLQTVLCNLYHIDNPTGNVKLNDVKAFFNEKHPLIKEAIPLSLGDSYRGHRIVGTVPALGDRYDAKIAAGAWWTAPLEIVAGATAAQSTGLSLGDQIESNHGLTDDGLGHSHDEKLTVTGILAPTGTIIDHLLLTSYASTWIVHGEHDHEHAHDEDGHADDDHDHDHEEQTHHHASQHDHSHHGHEQDHHDHGHDQDHHDHGHEHDGHGHDEHDHEHDGHHHHHEDGHENDHDAHDHTQDAKTHHHASQHDHHDHDDHGHEHHDHHGEIPALLSDLDREVTSVLIEFHKESHATLNMMRAINDRSTVMATRPSWELTRLYALTGSASRLLSYLVYVIGAVAFISIFLSLLQQLDERRYELALLRVMGSRPPQLRWLVLAEGWLQVWMGYVLGVVLAHIGLLFVDQLLSAQYRYAVQAFQFGKYETWILVAVTLLGLLASLYPAITASKTDVSETLQRG